MWAGEYQKKMAMRTNDHRSWKRMSDFFMTPHQRFDTDRSNNREV